MPAIQARGGSFSLDQFGIYDDSPFVAVVADLRSESEPVPLLLVVDPVEPVPGVSEVAQDILNGMAVYLRHTMDHDIRGALVQAFKTANQRVCAENETRNGMRRIYLGLTCVVLHGDELYVAQVAPSQVLVWQDTILHAIPSLETWSAHDINETFSDLSYPLGFHATVEPRIAYSRCAPGDVISVVSWTVARRLALIPNLDGVGSAGEFLELVSRSGGGNSARTYHGAVYEFATADRLPTTEYAHSHGLPLDGFDLSGDSRDTYTRERTDIGHRRDDGTQPIREDWDHFGGRATVGFDRLVSGQPDQFGTDVLPSFDSQGRSGAHVHVYNLSASPRHFSEPDNAPVPQDVHKTGTNNTFAGNRPARRAARPGHRGRIVEIFAGLLLSLTAAVVGVWQVTKRDRPIHGPRDDGTLGLPHLQRWSDTYHRPRFERLRRASPRFQMSGAAMIAIAVTVVLLASALIYSQVADRIHARTAGIEEQLDNIAAVRGQAASMPDQQAAYQSLMDADKTLAELASNAGDDDLAGRVEDEQQAIGQSLDELAAVERLTSVQVVGSVPSAPDGVEPRLFQGNGRVYVFTNGLYELDQTTGSLVQLLGPGDVVGGSPVGALLAADWSDDRPVVMDAHNAFLLDPVTSAWQRVPVGILSPAGYTSVVGMAAFDRNLYILSPESGQILKFNALDFSVQPEDWTAGVSKDDLKSGVDLLVDGSIQVALRDGRVLSFFRSALEKTMTPQVMPPLDSVSAITSGPDGAYYYLVNQSDGRIVCIDENGIVIRQYVTAAGAPSLAGATDLVVDATNGISHVIVGNTLYAVRLPLPES